MLRSDAPRLMDAAPGSRDSRADGVRIGAKVIDEDDDTAAKAAAALFSGAPCDDDDDEDDDDDATNNGRFRLRPDESLS